MTITASRPSNRAQKPSNSSNNTQHAEYDLMNNSAGPSYSNNLNASSSRHFYLNGDEEEDAIDELQAIGSSQVMPYELNTGSINGDAQSENEGIDESDDDELSTTSGRRHGALLQPEEADLIIFEVIKMARQSWRVVRNSSSLSPFYCTGAIHDTMDTKTPHHWR